MITVGGGWRLECSSNSSVVLGLQLFLIVALVLRFALLSIIMASLCWSSSCHDHQAPVRILFLVFHHPLLLCASSSVDIHYLSLLHHLLSLRHHLSFVIICHHVSGCLSSYYHHCLTALLKLLCRNCTEVYRTSQALLQSLMPNRHHFIILLSSCYCLNFFLLPSYISAYFLILLSCLSVILTCLTSYHIIIVLHAVSLYCFTIDFLDSFQNSRQFQFPPKIEIISVAVWPPVA